MVQFPRVQREKAEGDFSIHPSNKEMRIGIEPILEHDYITGKGDSGTPLLVQPPGFNSICFIVSIHSSTTFTSGHVGDPVYIRKRQSVKITE
jgi:hypothetical protein